MTKNISFFHDSRAVEKKNGLMRRYRLVSVVIPAAEVRARHLHIIDLRIFLRVTPIAMAIYTLNNMRSVATVILLAVSVTLMFSSE